MDCTEGKRERVQLATAVATGLSFAALIAGAVLTHMIYCEVQDVRQQLDAEMRQFKV